VVNGKKHGTVSKRISRWKRRILELKNAEPGEIMEIIEKTKDFPLRLLVEEGEIDPTSLKKITGRQAHILAEKLVYIAEALQLLSKHIKRRLGANGPIYWIDGQELFMDIAKAVNEVYSKRAEKDKRGREALYEEKISRFFFSAVSSPEELRYIDWQTYLILKIFFRVLEIGRKFFASRGIYLTNAFKRNSKAAKFCVRAFMMEKHPFSDAAYKRFTEEINYLMKTGKHLEIPFFKTFFSVYNTEFKQAKETGELQELFEAYRRILAKFVRYSLLVLAQQSKIIWFGMDPKYKTDEKAMWKGLTKLENGRWIASRGRVSHLLYESFWNDFLTSSQKKIAEILRRQKIKEWEKLVHSIINFRLLYNPKHKLYYGRFIVNERGEVQPNSQFHLNMKEFIDLSVRGKIKKQSSKVPQNVKEAAKKYFSQAKFPNVEKVIFRPVMHSGRVVYSDRWAEEVIFRPFVVQKVVTRG